MSLIGGILLIAILLGFFWVGFLVSTHGWEQTKSSILDSLHGAAYAMKETSEDAAVTAKIKTALSLSKRIPASEISVDTQNNVVTLRGEVASQEIRDLAETIAADISGVKEVHNHLYVIDRSR